MDRRSRRDRGQASQKAEDRSRRCATSAEADAGGSLSADLGTKSGESRSAATAVASASFGTNAHANHESVASPRDERGQALEEQVVERTGPSAVREPSLGFWANRRRRELLELLDRMNPTIEELTAAAAQEAKKRPEALRLMTHPGAGPLTALTSVLIIGTPTRFQCGKQIGTYVGMIPSEDCSGGKQRLGHISRQGSLLLRFCWLRQLKWRHESARSGDVATCI